MKVEKVNPRLQVIFYDTLNLDHKGHELTAVRFTMDADGAVGNVNTRTKSLIQQTRKPSAGNALR